MNARFGKVAAVGGAVLALGGLCPQVAYAGTLTVTHAPSVSSGSALAVTHTDSTPDGYWLNVDVQTAAGGFTGYAMTRRSITVGEGTQTTTWAVGMPAGTYKLRWNTSTNFNVSGPTDTMLTVVEPPPLPGVPGPVVGVAAADDESGALVVNLSWAAGSNATSYNVERSTGGAGYSALATVTGNTMVDTTVAALTTYSYRVRSVNSTGNSAYTAGTSVSTPSGPPPGQVTPGTWRRTGQAALNGVGGVLSGLLPFAVLLAALYVGVVQLQAAIRPYQEQRKAGLVVKLGENRNAIAAYTSLKKRSRNEAATLRYEEDIKRLRAERRELRKSYGAL